MKPIKIEINNLFKYGTKTNIFNFYSEQLSLIVGPNGAGKSSIFEAITFALFGQTTRWGVTKAQILRRGANSGSAAFEFEHNGNNYEVIRSRDPGNHGAVRFTCLTTGEVFGKGLKDTDKEIVNLIGFDFEAFRNSVLFGQGDLAKIVSLRSSERYELLTNFLGLLILNKCSDISRAKLFISKDRIKMIDTELELRNRVRLKKELKSLQEVVQVYKETLQEAEEKYSNLNELVKKLQRLEAADTSARNTLKNTAKELNSLNRRKDQLKEISGDSAEKIKDLELQLDNVQIVRGGLKEIEAEIAERNTILKEKTEGKISSKLQAKNAKDKINYIQKKKICSECQREYTEEVKTKLMDHEKEVLTIAGNKYQALKKQIGEITKRLDTLERKREKIISLPTAEDLQDRIRETQKLLKVDSEIEEIEVETKRKEAARNRATIILEDIKAEDYSADRLERLRKGLLKTKGTVAEHQTKLAGANREIERMQAEIKAANVLDKEREELVKKTRNQEFVVEMFSKTGGVRQIIIENVLPVLNEKVNKYLDILSDEGISAEFTTGAKTKSGNYKEKLDIFIISPEGIADFESYSGGEKQSIILAIGLGLSELAAKSSSMNCDLLFLDEVFSSLDDKARKRLVNLLYSLRNNFSSVIVISHLKELRSQLPDVAVVKRIERRSVIKQNV